MSKTWTWTAIVGLMSAGCFGTGGGAETPRHCEALPDHGVIAIVGDLQRTEWYEALIGREDNDRERAMVIDHIAKGRASVVLSLGDMVFRGDSRSQWRDFDDLVLPLKDRGMPILAAAGNHDWLHGTKDAINSGFRARFLPAGRTATWQWHRIGSLGIVVIDSNVQHLSEKMRTEQQAWFKATLDSFEGDKTIGGVMVAVHHPRFTNGVGWGVGDWDHRMTYFAEQSDAHPKAFLMVSGHTHSYERFETTSPSGTRHYLVSGGGGGPRRAVEPGAVAHPDRYRHPGEEGDAEIRPFNVIWASQDSTGLRLQVMGLEKGADQFARMEELRLPWRW